MPVRKCQIQKTQEHGEKVKRQQIDHIAEKRYVGSFHYGLANEPVSFQEAVKIQEAKAAVDK